MIFFMCSILQHIPLFDADTQDSSSLQDLPVQAGLKILQVENACLIVNGLHFLIGHTSFTGTERHRASDGAISHNSLGLIGTKAIPPSLRLKVRGHTFCTRRERQRGHTSFTGIDWPRG